MSSKESEFERGRTEERSADPNSSNNNDNSARRRRTFDRSASSGEYISDVETDDETPPSGPKKKSRTGIGSFLYKSNRKNNLKGNNIGNGNGNGKDNVNVNDKQGGQSHLFGLVRQQKAINKYTKNHLKSQKNSAVCSVVDQSNEKVKAEATDGDATGLAEEGRMKIDNIKTESRSTIDSYGGSKSSIDATGAEYNKPVVLTDDQKEEANKTSKGILLLQETLKEYTGFISRFPIEIRMEKLSFSVPYTEASTKITTVYNSSFLYKIIKPLRSLTNGAKETNHAKVSYTKHVLDNISLSLKPGKMYLVLGPPASGKSSLLKAIAGRLFRKGKEELEGSVTYNGTELYDSKGFYDQPNVHLENAISLIDQLDRHAPRYTVEETFNFAFKCKRRNGRHIDFRFQDDTPKNRELAKKADDSNILVDIYIKLLGIDHVRHSFVGNDDIRGVSGGQRRRVTIGEMLMNNSPVICGDEISNGLDAESTFDIISTMGYIGKGRQKLQVISLLQPSPEIVALFDEVILLAEGKILYAGPILRVENYFASLGYVAPRSVSLLLFLLCLRLCPLSFLTIVFLFV
jgi:ABC-type multidrug transport system ATPase subunit